MDDKPGNKGMSKPDIVSRSKAWFKNALEAETKQRERERSDLEFQIPELQWDADARQARQGGVLGNQITPARPMLSISLMTQPMQLIRNQAANARLGVRVHPISEDADEDLAEVKQGLYRRIERDSNADVARLWALDRAVQCGRGWYRINTQWDEDSPETGDQEIVIERIYDQSSVYMDPAATKSDYSDARWGMIVCWVPVEDFKNEWPDAEVPQNDTEFNNWFLSDPDWVKNSDGSEAVLVAEVFYKITDFEDVQVGDMTRKVEKTRVRYCKVTARDVLEETDWNGRLIPIVPVIGRELQPFDGEHRWSGMVREARDGQKFFNYAASTLAESMAMEPKAPFIGAEGQFEGHEEEWGSANTRNLPFIEYKMQSLGDQLAPPPQRAQVDGGRMNLALQALMQAKSFVQTSTSVYAPSLGEMPDEQTAQSGRAILALQQQSDAGTGHFLESLAKVSMMYEARVILDLMPSVYDRPGRITQILGEEDESEQIMLNAPFVPGQDGGPPQAVLPPVPGMAPQMQPQNMKHYDLNKGKYSISVNVGKSFQTRLQEGQAEIGGILERSPDLMSVIGDLYFKFREFPGAQEISSRLARIREKNMPGIAGEEDDGMTLEQAQAGIQALQSQMQQMGQALQQAQQALETDKAKQEATLVKAQMDNQMKLMIAKLDAQTELMKTMVKARADHINEQMKSEDKESDRQHEADSDVFEAGHEAAMAVLTNPPPRGSLELEEPE